MEAAPFAISAQVLAEFYTIATNPRREYLTSAEALGWVMRLAKMPCATTDAALVRDGIEVSERYKISYWDGAIIAAAERLGAKTLYTEDLNDGQIYGAVTARNPFN
jgi:predicted nucleic acid-binding protein